MSNKKAESKKTNEIDKVFNKVSDELKVDVKNVNTLTFEEKQILLKELMQGENFEESSKLQKQARNLHRQKADSLTDDQKRVLVEDINVKIVTLYKQIAELKQDKKARLDDLGIDHVTYSQGNGKRSMFDFSHSINETKDVFSFSIHKDGYNSNYICKIPITIAGNKEKNNYITKDSRMIGVRSVVDGKEKESGFKACGVFFGMTDKEFNNHATNTWLPKLVEHCRTKEIDVYKHDNTIATV